MLTTAPKLTSECPDCGLPIPPAAPEGLCPRCLVRESAGVLLQSSPQVELIAERRFFGDYELLEEIGRGGTAIVFKARQFGLNRIVALKLLSSGPAASRDFVHRFHTEAAAAAHLEHPNIVPIYEFGEHEGTHFLAMRFLEGGTLQEQIARARPSSEQAAQLLLHIANAVEFAHRRGILHRDLKPGNILLDSEGTSYVTDFGLARVLEQDSSLTLTQSILGTAAFLAPEVASSGAAIATTSSDIYGLGAILYQLLTGEPPFQKPTLPATLRAIAEEQPLRPQVISASVSADLETICLKCLEKNASKRYTTAQALADDLQRFLDGEPITARPISRPARVVRWSQRNPALATAYCFLILLLIIVVIGSPLAAYRINEARKAETSQRARAEEGLYAAHMLLTQGAIEEGKLRRASELLEQHDPNIRPGLPDHRGWEWNYFKSKTGGGERFILGYHQDRDFRGAGLSGVSAVGFIPDGKRAWSAGWDKVVRIWDIAEKREILRLQHDRPVFDGAHSPDGRWLATVTASEGNRPEPQTVRLWNLENGQLVDVLGTNQWPRQLLRFSPDGRLIATEDIKRGGISILEVASRREVAFLGSQSENMDPIGFAFCPQNQTVAYASGREGEIVLYDLAAHSKLGTLEGHTRIVHTLAFSPDGRFLVSGGRDRTLRLWDLTGAAGSMIVSNFTGVSFSVRFSSDGRRLAILDESEEAKILEISSGKLRSLRGHFGLINAIDFQLDGQTILTGGEDGSLRIWDGRAEPITESAQPLERAVAAGLNSGSDHITLAPDGRHLLTVTMNGTFAVWNTRTRQSTGYAAPYTNVVRQAIAPGARSVVLEVETMPHRGSVLLAHLQEPLRWRSIFQLTNEATGRIRFSDDGTLLGFGRWPEFFVCDAETGRITQTCRENAESAYDLEHDVAFSPDNRRAAMVTHLGWVYCWNLPLNNRLWAVSLSKFQLSFVRFSPDGRIVLAGGHAGVYLFDAQTGQRLLDFDPSPHGGLRGAFAPDGKTVAVGEWPEISLWSMSSRQLVGRLRAHKQDVVELSFDRDSQALVSASFDEFRVWSAEDQQN